MLPATGRRAASAESSAIDLDGNDVVQRLAGVADILPNENSVTRPIGAAVLERNDELQIQCRYSQFGRMVTFANPSSRNTTATDCT